MSTIGSNSLADLAARINAEHMAAASAIERGIEHAIAAGELLIEAKAVVAHGQWMAWLADNTSLSERSAQRYMQLARERPALEAKSATVADLTIKSACKLIAKTSDDSDTIADDMLDRPFRESDDDLHWLGVKICHQIGLPAVPSFCFDCAEDYRPPMMRLCCDDDLIEALKLIVPYAKGTKSLDIEATTAKHFAGTAMTIQFVCQRMAGMILKEIDDRKQLTDEKQRVRSNKVLDKFRIAVAARQKQRPSPELRDRRA